MAQNEHHKEGYKERSLNREEIPYCDIVLFGNHRKAKSKVADGPSDKLATHIAAEDIKGPIP